MGFLIKAWLAFGALGMAACSSDSPPAESGRDAGASGELDAGMHAGMAELLGMGTVLVGEQEVPYELLRLPRADGQHTYVQWIRATDPGPQSVVVATQPYDGIDWSNEPVDLEFAKAIAGPDGRYLDSACPDTNQDSVAYSLSTPDAMAQSAVPYLINGHAVLLVYGRYYACDDLDGEVADMRAALSYLATRADADAEHVGLIGNSWGGFLALYGAAHAPAGVAVDALVAINPPSDFASWLSYLDELATTWPQPSQLDFFSSYRRRVQRATGGAPSTGDFRRFSHGALCSALGKIPTLLLHDQWDTLVPVAQSEGLVERCQKEGLWWPRQGPVAPELVGLDHGLLGAEPGYPSVFTFAQLYLLAQLNDPEHPVVALADRASLQSYLGLLHAEQAAGDVSWALPRLREASAAQVYFYLVAEMKIVDAAEVLAEAVNSHWGTSYDGASLRTQLAVGLPTQ